MAAQRSDPASTLACYRRMLALRKGSVALAGGSLEVVAPWATDDKVLAFRRTLGGETAHVYHNLSSQTVKLSNDLHPMAIASSSLVDGPVMSSARGTLRPWESLVFMERSVA